MSLRAGTPVPGSEKLNHCVLHEGMSSPNNTKKQMFIIVISIQYKDTLPLIQVVQTVAGSIFKQNLVFSKVHTLYQSVLHTALFLCSWEPRGSPD